MIFHIFHIFTPVEKAIALRLLSKIVSWLLSPFRFLPLFGTEFLRIAQRSFFPRWFTADKNSRIGWEWIRGFEIYKTCEYIRNLYPLGKAFTVSASVLEVGSGTSIQPRPGAKQRLVTNESFLKARQLVLKHTSETIQVEKCYPFLSSWRFSSQGFDGTHSLMQFVHVVRVSIFSVFNTFFWFR